MIVVSRSLNELHVLVNELHVLAIEWQSRFFACHSMADTQMLVLGASR